MHDTRKSAVAVPATLALLALLACTPAIAEPPAGGKGYSPSNWSDEVSPTLDARISAEIARNRAANSKLGGASKGKAATVTDLRWPLAPVPGAGRDWHGVSNFVDLDNRFPDHVRDFTCAARSYDLASGYNHSGTDFFIWPFPWATMDAGTIDVVAAAPGMIVAKADGNGDRSCSFNAPDSPNFIAIEQADGTIARYLHMKAGSVTPKNFGATVQAGEYLGKVGSSGMSTGPHLHFELRSADSAGSAVIDPFHGTCNAAPTRWAEQRPYVDPRLNRVATHSAPPIGASCPITTETPNFADHFNPGDRVVAAGYYTDQQVGTSTQYRVLRPDGSVLRSWSFDLAEGSPGLNYYAASYWFWNVDLPADAPSGLWTLEATYAGTQRTQVFHVGAVAPIRDPRGLSGAWYEATTSGQGFEFQSTQGDRMLVIFYGHRDDGSNLFLFGAVDRRFDYGQSIDVPLVSTRGGRFNSFDAAAIHRDAWGSARLRFDSCDRATVDLTGSDGSKHMELIRLTRAADLPCD